MVGGKKSSKGKHGGVNTSDDSKLPPPKHPVAWRQQTNPNTPGEPYYCCPKSPHDAEGPRQCSALLKTRCWRWSSTSTWMAQRGRQIAAVSTPRRQDLGIRAADAALGCRQGRQEVTYQTLQPTAAPLSSLPAHSGRCWGAVREGSVWGTHPHAGGEGEWYSPAAPTSPQNPAPGASQEPAAGDGRGKRAPC